MKLDKMPLGAYIEDIATQVIKALERVEASNPGWTTGSVEILAGGVLKPVREGEKTVVYVDIDEPEKFPRSEIPIKIARTHVLKDVK